MSDRVLKMSLAIGAMCFFTAGALARSLPQGAGAKYQVVKVCSLLSLAEVKKLAPWSPEQDASAKAKEEAFGSNGSSCDYPELLIVVRAFYQSSFDFNRKRERVEAVSGVGDEAYVHHTPGAAAELIAKVGPHELGVVLFMEKHETFESKKPTLIAIGKAYAAKLR